MLEAMELGSTRVIGQAIGQDPETGETVVYSQVCYNEMFTQKDVNKIQNYIYTS